MNLLQKIKDLFEKNSVSKDFPPIPTWDEIVEIMYNKDLNNIQERIVKIFYSKDRSKRALIIQNDKGFYQYSLEYIYQFDEDEWMHITHNENTLPAMWIPFSDGNSWSAYDTSETAFRNLLLDPIYQKYFK